VAFAQAAEDESVGKWFLHSDMAFYRANITLA